jgi:hypothetical protein
MFDINDIDPMAMADVAESTGYSDGGHDPAEEIIDAAEESIFANAYLMDIASQDEICDVAEDYNEMDSISDLMGISMETSIVRLDRKSRLKHLRKANILHLARKSNNPKFRKLLTIWKMERELESDLDKVYGAKATTLANQQIRNWATNGIKKIPKAYPDTVVGKKKPSAQITQRAVAQGKKMFNSPKTQVPQQKQFKW